jgi:hypothetical protein
MRFFLVAYEGSAGQGGEAVTATFPDRWGVPVQSASEKAVAVLDEAVEQLAALAGDPVAANL